MISSVPEDLPVIDGYISLQVGSCIPTDRYNWLSVVEAQVEWAQMAWAKAAKKATNVEGIKRLAYIEMTMIDHSYTAVYKNNLMIAVDSDHEQAVSIS